MKVLDSELDTKPTARAVKLLADLRIRNLLAFRELQMFNDTGKWLYQHPLIKHQSERAQLLALKQNDPEEFLKQYAACNHNIKRYSSYIKNKDRESSRAKDKKNLRRHQDKALLFKSILENENI